MTLYKRFNHAILFFDFASTISIHVCFEKQACKSHFITNLETTKKTLGIIRIKVEDTNSNPILEAS